MHPNPPARIVLNQTPCLFPLVVLGACCYLSLPAPAVTRRYPRLVLVVPALADWSR